METPREGSARPDDDERQRLADERDRLADQREAVLDAREARADARDAAQAGRRERASHILAYADERDGQAETRDAAAMTRDTAAGLDSFLHDGEHEYGPALKARRSAALDRTESKSDRAWAATDRSNLTKDDSVSPDVES